MRVLNLLYSDNSACGGAGIMMYRLHESLREAGVDSSILCKKKTMNSPYVSEIPVSRPIRKLEAVLRRLTTRLGFNDIHCVSSFGIKGLEKYRDTDIFHIHGLHGGFFSYLALPGLTEKPTVFSLHDMWPLTGHCASSYDCERWKTGCGRCPYPNIHPAVRRDATAAVWRLKKWVFSRSNFVIVSPSLRLIDQLKVSMLKDFKVHHIPYAVDTRTYEPLDAKWCRRLLGVPEDKKVLLFCAADIRNYYKGGDLLSEALKMLPGRLKSEILLMTLGRGAWPEEFSGIQCLNLGYISNDRLKAACYSASDILVYPTRSDNFPLVLLESLACATPVVSFDAGGISDIVQTGVTGYLARFEDAKDFSKGVSSLIENDAVLRSMRKNCREIAQRQYDLKSHAGRVIKLYGEMLQS